MWSHRIPLIALLFATGWSQACIQFDAEVSRPTEYVGRWARLVGRDSWTDTVELFADGQVRGRDGSAVVDATRWNILHTRFGNSFCFGRVGKPNCQESRLEGDTLVLGFMPHVTYWRRAH